MTGDEEKQEITNRFLEVVRKEIKTSLADKEETKSVNGKVLAFGIIAIGLVIACICGALMLLLYSSNNRYVESASNVIDCKSTLTTIQTELAEKNGKLLVYEEYLTDKRRDIIQKTIADYLLKEKVKTTEVTLEDFKNWMFGVPRNGGIGGPVPGARPFQGGSSR